MLQMLADFVKQGLIGRLEVVNVEAHAEIARSLGIRSVPWVRIGPFELAGVRTRDELNLWIQRASSPSGMADYFHDMLKEGELARVLAAVKGRTRSAHGAAADRRQPGCQHQRAHRRRRGI
jgi:thioredoxin-like negative regulator of GroEL